MTGSAESAGAANDAVAAAAVVTRNSRRESERMVGTGAMLPKQPSFARILCQRILLMRSRLLSHALGTLVGGSLFAAELTVKPEDLPRVPPTLPEKAAATCMLRPGFHLELMA